LAKLAKEREVGLLLIGKPLHMSGDESRQSEYTAEFAERLAKETGLPLMFWDERLTTVQAGRILQEANATLAERKKAIDRLSAVLLLESYLDSRRYSEGNHVE
jgi:putative holliday junction resolvase